MGRVRLARPGVAINFTGKELLGGGGKVRYHFDGATMYVTHSSWDTLGDFGVYGNISFQVEAGAPLDDVVVSTPPVVEFGRVGANYHDGAIWDVRYTDNSPIQQTNVKSASVGTIGPFEMTGGSVRFDYIHAANEDIIVGYLSAAAGVLTLSANAANLKVDGQAYAGATMNVGQHYTVSFDTTGGTLTTVNATSGMQNLEINT